MKQFIGEVYILFVGAFVPEKLTIINTYMDPTTGKPFFLFGNDGSIYNWDNIVSIKRV